MATHPYELETSPPAWPRPRTPRLPPLENGDRLNSSEFLARWKETPWIKRAELIEGIVYMNAAVRLEFHGSPHLTLAAWLGTYLLMTPGLDGGDNTTIVLDEENLPQPDLFLYLMPIRGGQTRGRRDGHLIGAPELVVEIAASSSGLDLHAKRQIYERFGVKEYVVWRVLDEAFAIFDRQEGSLMPVVPVADGVWKSRTFPGLWLDTAAVVRRDGPAMLARLAEGMATPEFAAFRDRVPPPAPPA